MRKLLFLILLTIGAVCQAQTLETTDPYPSGYITTYHYSAGNTIKTIDGVLYMVSGDVPVVLVKYPPMNERTVYEVPSTVMRICNNAFEGTKYLRTLRLHSTVTFGRFMQLKIGESAFNNSSIVDFEVIEDNETSMLSLPEDASTQRKEVARYDISGREIRDTVDGIQIITYDDHTTQKVLK